MWFPRLWSSSFVPWLHLAMEMQEMLDENQLMMKQLFQLQKHPSLSTAQRLLTLEWIEAIGDKIETSVLEDLNPSPFDGYDTRSKKIKILASQREVPLSFLLKCLEGLFKGVKRGGRPAVVFFQTLYSYFVILPSPALVAHSNRFFFHLVDLAPATIVHVMDFVSCLREINPKSPVAEEILGNVVNHILETPPERCMDKLDWYFMFMQEVSVENPTISRPKEMLKFLQKLLNVKTVCNDWVFGHDILSTVFCILKKQDIEKIFAELGDVLYILMMQSDDIDIRSRAKLYYAAVMSMTPEKVKQLFDLAKTLNDEEQSYLEPGTSAFPLVAPIQLLEEQAVLKIYKFSSSYANEESILEDVENISSYQDFISVKTDIQTVRVKFILEIIENCEDKFKKLFGVVLRINCNPSSCSATQKIVIPVLVHGKDATIDVDITPWTPWPLWLYFSAEFSASLNETYACKLERQLIKLHDLFLPLPVAHEKREWLFEGLWEDLLENGHHSIVTYSVSLEELTAKWEHCLISEERIGIFLPPRSHLLLKLSERKCFLVATDILSILPWLNNFLCGLDDSVPFCN